VTSSYRYRHRYEPFGDRGQFIPYPYCFRAASMRWNPILAGCIAFLSSKEYSTLSITRRGMPKPGIVNTARSKRAGAKNFPFPENCSKKGPTAWGQNQFLDR
jgi:hypothetical protein